MEKSNIDQFCFGVRNAYSAQNQFPAITQTEGMVDRTGKPVEEITGIAEERKGSTKSCRDVGITKIPEFYLRYDGETKAHRGPEHYFGIIRQSTRTTK